MLDHCLLDAAGGLDLLAVLVDAVGYDRLGSVLVLGDCLLGEGEVVLVFLFGPVGAAAGALVYARGGVVWQYAPCYARHGGCVMCDVWCVFGGVGGRRAWAWSCSSDSKMEWRVGQQMCVRYNI